MPPVVPGEEEADPFTGRSGSCELSQQKIPGMESLHAAISPAAPLIIFMFSSSLLSYPLGDSRVNKIIN